MLKYHQCLLSFYEFKANGTSIPLAGGTFHLSNSVMTGIQGSGCLLAFKIFCSSKGGHWALAHLVSLRVPLSESACSLPLHLGLFISQVLIEVQLSGMFDHHCDYDRSPWEHHVPNITTWSNVLFVFSLSLSLLPLPPSALPCIPFHSSAPIQLLL